MAPIDLLKKLNYSMKCHLDNLETEQEEFNERKDRMKSQAKQEGKIQQSKTC